ncbi:MAG: RNA polymerase sigma factor for flagellar operon FliA [Alcanivorax sp.]|jgi:RNA polymerase sigma factor for flagellar operon FliA
MNDLVKQYLPLVKKIGLHLVARLPQEIQLDDLLQVGMIGLVQAVENYDPSQGASFNTFAGIRVKGAMLDEVRRSDWRPRSVQQKMKSVSRAIEQVEARVGRIATDTEIAEELEMTLDEYQLMSGELACSRMTSLEDSEVLVDENQADDPLSQIEKSKLKKALSLAIQKLPEKERLMMSLYYRDELNLKEIGEVLGVSESRVSQIHGQALARLRPRIAEWVE